MSIILKGIDLPKEKEALGSKWRVVIHLAIDSNGLVTEQDSYGEWLPTNIEAIQIPKGHGRLIDADLLKDMVRDSVPAYGIGVKIPTYGDMDIMDKIGFMPTILEGEE